MATFTVFPVTHELVGSMIWPALVLRDVPLLALVIGLGRLSGGRLVVAAAHVHVRQIPCVVLGAESNPEILCLVNWNEPTDVQFRRDEWPFTEPADRVRGGVREHNLNTSLGGCDNPPAILIACVRGECGRNDVRVVSVIVRQHVSLGADVRDTVYAGRDKLASALPGLIAVDDLQDPMLVDAVVSVPDDRHIIFGKANNTIAVDDSNDPLRTTRVNGPLLGSASANAIFRFPALRVGDNTQLRFAADVNDRVEVVLLGSRDHPLLTRVAFVQLPRHDLAIGPPLEVEVGTAATRAAEAVRALGDERWKLQDVVVRHWSVGRP